MLLLFSGTGSLLLLTLTLEQSPQQPLRAPGMQWPLTFIGRSHVAIYLKELSQTQTNTRRQTPIFGNLCLSTSPSLITNCLSGRKHQTFLVLVIAICSTQTCLWPGMHSHSLFCFFLPASAFSFLLKLCQLLLRFPYLYSGKIFSSF